MTVTVRNRLETLEALGLGGALTATAAELNRAAANITCVAGSNIADPFSATVT